MPFVYRIEDHKGQGPYRDRNFSLDIPQACSDDHPNPLYEEGLRWWQIKSEEWYFGFDSMSQLQKWFYDPCWLQEMHHAGLRISIYEVSEEYFRTSKSQAVFIRDEALHIATRSLIH